MAKLTHLLSFLLFIGLLNERPLCFVCFGALLGVVKLMSAPVALLKGWHGRLPAGTLSRLLSLSRLALLPLGLGAVFASIYYHANPHFASFLDRSWPGSWLRLEGGILFRWLLGLFIVAALGTSALWEQEVEAVEAKLPEQLQRGQARRWKFGGSTMALKNEYQNSADQQPGLDQPDYPLQYPSGGGGRAGYVLPLPRNAALQLRYTMGVQGPGNGAQRGMPTG